ncbi:hypothetical protein MVEN_02438700 [Mycena venus]|uniref:DUF6534 domain-containing protein n=1 Tax=Mycena venus TaxID=2733690 RepID=A0A8H7CBP1_9AGAR|nr:hypothetical protein MVEN_02438700 [Mycena venus]
MSTAAIPFPVFDVLLAQTYGIALAGVFVSCALFGVVALQVFIYYTKKTKDPFLIRAMPAFLLVMEFIHQVLLCVGIYKPIINHFGDEGIAAAIFSELFVWYRPDYLKAVLKILQIASFFQGLCATSAHLFYTYRICMFRKGLWIVPCISIPLTLTQLAFNFANQILTLIHRDIAYIQTIAFTVYVTHGVNAFLDIFFVVCMVILLSKEYTIFSQTQSMIRRLTVMVINTGLITTIATLLTIIFIGVQPATFTYAFFNFWVSPLYANSVMANLNSRDYIRGRRENSNTAASGSIELNAWHINNTTSHPTLPTQAGSGETKVMNGVAISQDTIMRKDDRMASTVGYKLTGDV